MHTSFLKNCGCVVWSVGGSLKGHLKGLTWCFCFRASPELRQLPKWHLLRAFKGKCNCHGHLDQSISLGQTIDKEAWEWRSWGRKNMERKGSEKLPHILGNLEGHTNARVWTHAQKTPEKNLCSHLWLNFRLMWAGMKAKEEIQIVSVALLKKISNKS